MTHVTSIGAKGEAPHILLAPDSFKGSLTAREAAEAMAEGVSRACPSAQLALVPIADGGEGTLAAIATSTRARWLSTEVTAASGQPKQGRFLALPDGTAVVECAEAVGLPEALRSGADVWRRTTVGVGEMIRHALETGHRRIAVALGGSATNDAGVGMLAALGVRLLDDAGQDVPPVPAEFHRVARVDVSGLDERLRGAEMLAVCDVDNPLTGENGATTVFGPQKGVSTHDVPRLDEALAHLAARCEAAFGCKAADLPGAGAAGGLGFALYLLGAARVSGIDFVLDAVGFDHALERAALVLTGEGRTDAQTAHGKAVAGVARRAKARGVPVFCISGAIGPGAERLYDHGVSALFATAPGPIALDEAMANAKALLAAAAENAVRAWLAGRP
ncbi:glycerate kinase [Alicyclobacillus acidocaldarius]|uniref:Glycerate kinase n=1 Tax=Alicyclobacillus acidocaldarius subsp. acidocaldarius (strain ATCC 27009 / DSM 446 / BCRC 14685 / JCM 5260 / KCTC 1825 / NBRC 15652 / NCIMB 11725 / NRRL B-14509 / 104-IA) TaxID=521098 RepID=C8WRP0_ALIAD|nr:glycerate kinase [Alicyclobacillus acidocaldarius]ACV59301.1 glycerate kinase [Alicyclobacillus acidocaldarius subsp. acidocaldarius DSM 446]